MDDRQLAQLINGVNLSVVGLRDDLTYTITVMGN
jgi:hypothetical protein